MAESDAGTEADERHRAAATAFVDRVAERGVAGVEQLILFGSTARGDARGLGSDVDFLAVVSDDADRRDVADALWDVAYDVMLEHGPVVEVHVLTRSRFDRYRETGHPFVEAALREGEVRG